MHGWQTYKDLYENSDKKFKNIIIRKKIWIKKPNFIAIMDSFLPVWLFSRSYAIWGISQFHGCQGL